MMCMYLLHVNHVFIIYKKEYAGLIANWKDKIQGLLKDFQGPKITVFKYQKYR